MSSISKRSRSCIRLCRPCQNSTLSGWNPPSTPVPGQRHLIPLGVALLHGGQRVVEHLPVPDRDGLRRRPGPELGAARPRLPVGLGLGDADQFHRPAHVHLPVLGVPGEGGRGVAGGPQVVALGRGVVGEEHHAALVQALAQHGARGRPTVRARGGQHHRVRLGVAGRLGLGQPASQLLVPGRRQVAQIEPVGAVVHPHGGQLTGHVTSVGSRVTTLGFPNGLGQER